MKVNSSIADNSLAIVNVPVMRLIGGYRNEAGLFKRINIARMDHMSGKFLFLLLKWKQDTLMRGSSIVSGKRLPVC